MRIGILSDTHDRLVRTQRAVTLLIDAGAEALFHCGDFTTPAILITCAQLPLYFVFGNNDHDMVPFLKEAAAESGATSLEWGGVVELGGKRLGMTHGHMTTDLRRVLAQSPDYLFSGHSHLVDDHRDGTVRRINPGALHRALTYTVALLDLETDNLEILDVPR